MMALTVWRVALYGLAGIGCMSLATTMVFCWFAGHSLRTMDQDR